MKRLVVGTLAIAVLALPRLGVAQTRTLTAETKTETGTVEAVEASTRTITLRKGDGTLVSTVAGPDIKRFDEVKVGDKITARYYDTVILRMKPVGEADTNSKAAGTTGSNQALPGGTRAKQRTLTVTITAIDPSAATATFTGPNGYKYTSKVQDTEALAKAKVGDKLDIVWTEAVLVSVERGK
jgi:hypothetical protein